MTLTRRTFVKAAAASGAAFALPGVASGETHAPLMRTIPSSGEAIPAVGLGTWITFNVGDDPVLRDECADVIAAFFEAGGRMIDSSPMYGSSQPVIGYGLERLGRPEHAVFRREGLDLLRGWRTCADRAVPALLGRPTLRPRAGPQSRRLGGASRHPFAMKADERIRYVGITTSEGRRHDLFEQIMRAHPLDFVQLTYNVVDREAEERLLPLAAERGMAVIVNRPFRQGALTQRLEGEPLPDWAAEIGAETWAQFILKFILAHPAVTVAIPATTRVDHVRENMAAAAGPLPDAAMRERMAAHVRDL